MAARAAEALRIGLVQEVVDEDNLLNRGIELATLVASRAPLGVQASRRSSQLAVEQGFEGAKDALMSEARRLMSTEDAQEGMLSFMQRRDAKFSGR